MKKIDYEGAWKELKNEIGDAVMEGGITGEPIRSTMKNIKKKHIHKKKIYISDDDMKWFKGIINIVSKGFTELDNIKVIYKGIGKWNRVSFSYKDIDLRKK